MRAVAAVLVLTVGCAATPVRPVSAVDESKWVETQPLPPHPKSLPLPDGLDPGDEKVVLPVDQGMCDAKGAPAPCPEMDGLLVSEARAQRDAFFRIQYEELRTRYEADRAVWSAQRALYEGQIQLDARHIETLQPTWWERHDGTILGVVGFAVGSAVMLGLAKAMAHVEGK